MMKEVCFAERSCSCYDRCLCHISHLFYHFNSLILMGNKKSLLSSLGRWI